MKIFVLENYNFQIEDFDYIDNKLKLITLLIIEINELKFV